MFNKGFGKIFDRNSCSLLKSIDQTEFSRELNRHRVLLFRDQSISSEDFLTLGERLQCRFKDYRGGGYVRERIADHPTMFSVTAGRLRRPVPFHGEMGYRRHRPDLLWFYCRTPALRRGETILCHGGRVYRGMPIETLKFFEEHRVCYIRNYTVDKWQATFETNERVKVETFCREQGMEWTWRSDGGLETRYVGTAVQEHPDEGPVFVNNILTLFTWEMASILDSVVRTEDGSPIPKAIVRDIWRTTRRESIALTWRRGDIAVIDNRVIMHGRRTIVDDERDIYVRMSGPINSIKGEAA